MKQYYLTVLFLLVCLFSGNTQDLILDLQNNITPSSVTTDSPILEELNKRRTTVTPKAPFQFIRKSAENNEVLFLDFQPQIHQSLLQEKSSYLELSIPVDATHELELELVKKDILSPGFAVISSSGEKDYSYGEKNIFYHGIVKGHPESLVVITIHENEMKISIKDSKGFYTLGKVKNSKEYVFYNEKGVVPSDSYACHTDDELHVVGTPSSVDKDDLDDKSMMCPIRVYLEVDHESFSHLGSVNATSDYVIGFFNQTVALYADNSIPMELASIKVWNTDDPYGDSEGTGSTSDQLEAFTVEQQNNFDGTLAHLITVVETAPPGQFTFIAGLAWLGVLCATYNPNNPSGPSGPTGYSQVYEFYSDYPTYSGTVSLFTHELGHNIGSSHTRACVWNGDNSAIDNCNFSGPVFTEGSCSATNDANGYTGTIMSYCSQSTLDFHPQVASLLQAEYATSTNNCVNNCAPPPNLDCTVAPPSSGTINAGDYIVNAAISTNGVVATSGNVNIQSGTSITLGMGFEVPAGATFSATIAPCDNFAPNDGVTERYNDEEEVELLTNTEGKRLSIAPNPFSEETIISYHLRNAGVVNIGVYDINGKKVATLVDGKFQNEGSHQLTYGATRQPKGIYTIVLSTGQEVISQRLVIMK